MDDSGPSLSTVPEESAQERPSASREDARRLVLARRALWEARQGHEVETAHLLAELAEARREIARLTQATVQRDRAVAALRGRLARLQAELAERREAPLQEPRPGRAAVGDPARPLGDVSEPVRAAYAGLLFAYSRALDAREAAGLNRLVEAQPLLHALAHALDGRRGVLVFSDIDPQSCDPAGGYAQRVLAVDGLLRRRPRFYARYAEANRGAPSLDQAGEDVWVLWLADEDPVSEALLDVVASEALVYVHSVLSVGVGASRRTVLAHADRTILDMHGATPEEFAMAGDEASARIFGAYERALYAAVARVVCVTEAMARHLLEKLAPPRAPAIICPIFHTGPSPVPVARRNARPRVIYAGGAQPWQQPDKMLDLIAASQANCDHVLLTPDLEIFAAGLAARGLSPGDRVTLACVPPEQTAAHYAASDFGFALRQDSVVNRVACPTKLIEYLAHDVIPILDSVQVGDFVAHGMQHVTVDQFASGALPDAEARRRMARMNRGVLERLSATAETGRLAILTFDAAPGHREQAAA